MDEQRDEAQRAWVLRFFDDQVRPLPVPLGPRAVGWLESDVSD